MRIRLLAEQLSKRILPLTALAVVTAMTVPAVADGALVYAVSDGTNQELVTMFHENEEAAVDRTSFGTEDYYIDSTAQKNDEYYTVQVRPKFTAIIEADGEETELYTGKATVEELCEAAGISLGADDETEPARDEVITDATKIQVIRVTKETESKTERIAYETREVKTKKLERGETKIKSEGKDGTVRKTYEIVYRNGKASERNLIKETVTKEAEDRVVLIGTKRPTVQTGSGKRTYSRALTVEATAYSGGGLTASGTSARVGAIAVDPSVIPLGSELYITSPDGSSWIYGYAVAEDTGGAIKGNRIDLYFSSEGECQSFGRQSAMVYVLD